MRVFVTGATGLIGFAVVRELISAGHQVTGLARSDASARKLNDAGAGVLRGDIEDLEVLRQGASAADGAIHTAFYHQITHMRLATRLRVMLGGSPSNIVTRFLTAAFNADRRAIETLGNALKGADRPLVATFGTLSLTPGILAIEDNPYDPRSVGAGRGATEDTMHVLASKGVRTSIIRLPPIVHGEDDRNGLVPMLIKIARRKNESAYVGEGMNRWPSVHKLDAARLFRLTLEKGPAGAAWHGVAEEGVPFRQIATLIGERLKVPIVSRTAAQASKQFGFVSPFIPVDNPASSTLTQERLGWRPTHPGLFTDLDKCGYFNTRS